MFPKCLSFALALSLLHVSSAQHVLAQTSMTSASSSVEGVETRSKDYAPVIPKVGSKEAEVAARVKAGIAKLGTGLHARVEVKLRDETKLKGYVSKATEDYFVVVEDKTDEAREVLYPQVKKVKGKNNLTGDQIGIIAVFALIIVTAIGYARK